MNVSKKSRLTTSLLSYFLGQFGVDLFYRGKTGLGILQIIMTVLFYAFYVLGYILRIVGVSTVVLLILGYVLLVLAIIIGIAVCAWYIVRLIKSLCGKATDANGDIISQWIIKND